MIRSHLITLFTFLGLLLSNADAQIGAAKTKAALISEYSNVTAGQSFDVALELTHEAHWHSYFTNAGIGYSIKPAIKWESPQGVKTSELRFPTPHEFSFSGANVYGHEGTNYFLTTVTIPDSAKVGEVLSFNSTASWQVCDDSSCLPPKRKGLSFQVTIADQATADPDYTKVALYNTKLTPQKDHPSNWNLSAFEDESGIHLNLQAQLPEGSSFFEYDGQIDIQAARTTTANNGNTSFSGKRNMGNDLGGEEGPKLSNLRGIIYVPSKIEGSDNQSFWVDVPFGKKTTLATGSATTTTQNTENEASEPELGVPVVLLFLLLGGLILNLMPCVFPVIGLKIMGFVQQAGEDTKKIKLHGIAFTVGVLLSFLVLATVLYPLKATTTLGSQLQEPWVVFILLVVMLLLALSMAGLFEIGVKATGVGGNLAHKEGLSGSFFSGVLAVVIATPCSAPFLGPAIGAAWKFDGPLFFISLLMMGVGLALPYITLSFFPTLVNKLPRPGAWMESFKQGMSFLLFATVGYLLWVYNGQIGEVGQKGLAIMLGVTAIAAAAWVYGRWSTPMKSTKTRLTANLIALVLAASGVALAMPGKEAEVSELEASTPAIEWQKWSQKKVDELLASGSPVYIDFTAKWCLTCQSNKATAYNAEVRKFIHDNKVVMLKADMTKSHPEATKAIHALNRSAIPVNVLYSPDDQLPHVTRELLTADYLLDFMQKHLKK